MYELDPAHPNGYFEHDSREMAAAFNSSGASGPSALQLLAQVLASHQDDMPARRWVPLVEDTITHWHGTLVPRLHQLRQENWQFYHGRSIMMRTYMDGSPYKVVAVKVGVERQATERDYLPYFHEWIFKLEADGTWSESERDVRVAGANGN